MWYIVYGNSKLDSNVVGELLVLCSDDCGDISLVNDLFMLFGSYIMLNKVNNCVKTQQFEFP
jgi:hypothetical protein